jgi:circadian clock protein KaiB
MMRLYIAGSAANSAKAIANLEALCAEHLDTAFKLEIVDVIEQPLRALADGVLVTPSLAKLSPGPGARMVGNLSDKVGLRLALGLKGKAR